MYWTPSVAMQYDVGYVMLLRYQCVGYLSAHLIAWERTLVDQNADRKQKQLLIAMEEIPPGLPNHYTTIYGWCLSGLMYSRMSF